MSKRAAPAAEGTPRVTFHGPPGLRLSFAGSDGVPHELEFSKEGTLDVDEDDQERVALITGLFVDSSAHPVFASAEELTAHQAAADSAESGGDAAGETEGEQTGDAAGEPGGEA
jgi:hypothetical protein